MFEYFSAAEEKPVKRCPECNTRVTRPQETCTVCPSINTSKDR